MTNYDLEEVKNLNYQMALSILLILTIIISISLTYNEKLKMTDKKPLYKDNESDTILKFNRIIAFFIGFSFLLINLNDRKHKKNDGKINLKSADLQIIASLLSLIGAGIVLYIAFSNNDEFIEIENPEL